MKNKNYKLYALIAVICCINSLFSATRTWTGGGGNGLWGNANNWSGTAVPTSADDVIINGGTFSGNITLPGAVTVLSFTMSAGTVNANTNAFTCTNLFSVSGGTFNMTTATLTANGGITMTGGTISSTTGIVSITGDLAMSGASVFNKTSTGNFGISQDLTMANTASFTGGTTGTLAIGSDIDMSGGTFTKNGGSVTTGDRWIIGGASTVINCNASTFGISDDISMSNGTVNGGTSSITASYMDLNGGTFNVGNTLIATRTTNSINIGGSAVAGAASAITAPVFNIFGGTFTKTAGSLSGNQFNLSGGVFTKSTNGTFTVTADIIMSGSSTLNAGSAGTAGTIDLNNDLFMTGGTMNCDNSVIDVQDSILQTGGTINGNTGEIRCTGTGAFNNAGLIQLSGGTLNIGDVLNAIVRINFLGTTITGAAASSTSTGAAGVTGDILITAGTVNFGSASNVDALNMTISGGTVTFGNTLDVRNAANTLGTLTISGGAVTAATTTIVVGTLAISSGSLGKTSGNVTINQSLALSSTGSFSPGTGTLGVGTNFTMNGTSTFTKVQGNVTVGVDFNMSGGTLDYGSTSGTFAITSGDFIISGGTFNLNNNISNVNVNGDDILMSGGIINNSGTFNVDDDLNMTGGTWGATATSDVFSTNGEIFLTSGTFALGNTLDAQVEIHFDGATVTGGTAATNIITSNGTSGEIEITSGTVTLTGEVDTDIFRVSGGTMTVGTTDFAISNDFLQTGGTFTKTGGPTVINDDLSISAGTLNAGTATWTMNDLLVSGSGILNIESATFNIDANVTISGSSAVNGGTGIIGSNTNTNDWAISGGTVTAIDATLNGENFTLTGGTVNADGDKIVLREQNGNLWINGGTLNITGVPLNVEENMIMQSGTLNLNGRAAVIEENYTFRGGTLTDPGDFTVLQNFTINHTGTHVMTYNLTASGVVTFTTGILYTTSTFMLIFNTNATLAGTPGVTRHVWGPVRKIGNTNTPFILPTGNGGVYAPVRILNFSGGSAADYFTATYYNERHPNAGGAKGTGLDHVSQAEYWILDRSGTVSVNVELDYNSARSGSITNFNDMRVARWDGSQWVNHGRGGGSSNSNTSGVLITSSPVSSFSPFTIGSGTTANPLPIILLSFDAKPVDKQVKVSWATTSEINNDFFTVQKSIDGKSWSVIGIVKGVGNSDQVSNYAFMDIAPVNGTQFYRLIQTDLNGTSTISKVIAINFASGSPQTTTISIFPNPAQNVVNVNLSASASDASIIVMNSMGMKVMEINNLSGSAFVLDMTALATGVYTVEVRHENGVTISKILKN